MKRLVTGLLAGCLLLTNAPIPTFADEVGTGTSDVESSFDSSVLYNSADLVVMIPDEVSLELNDSGDAFEGSGFVTAWGNAANSQEVKVTVDTAIEYQNAADSSITVDAVVSYDGDYNTVGYDTSRSEVVDVATWSGTTLRENVDATQKVGDDVEVYVPLSEVSDIGTYNSVIHFNIEVGTVEDGGSGDDSGEDEGDDGGEVVDIISDESDYVYYEDTYNGTEGYAVYGLSDTGLAKASATADAGQTFTLDVPDTYNGKPVITLDFNEGSSSGANDFNTVFSDEKYHDIAVVTGANTLYVEGTWNTGTTFLQKVSSIDLNDGLLEICSEAFKNKSGETSALRSVSIPASTTTIGSDSFSNHLNLETVTFEDGFSASVGDGVFGGSAIEKVYVPSSMTSFNAYAFNNTNLYYVSFNNNVENVTISNNFSSNQGVLLDFNNTDYIDYVNNSSYVFSGTIDENGDLHITNDSQMSTIGSSVYKSLSYYQAKNNSKLILDEGVTTVGVRLGNTGVSIQVPSTLTTVSKKLAFYGATFVGDADFRGVNISVSSVLGITKADNLYINAVHVPCLSDTTPTITNLYISNAEDGSSGSGSSTSINMSNIQNIYFGGTEADWETLKTKFSNYNTFTGNVYFNQSF